MASLTVQVRIYLHPFTRRASVLNLNCLLGRKFECSKILFLLKAAALSWNKLSCAHQGTSGAAYAAKSAKRSHNSLPQLPRIWDAQCFCVWWLLRNVKVNEWRRRKHHDSSMFHWVDDFPWYRSPWKKLLWGFRKMSTNTIKTDEHFVLGFYGCVNCAYVEGIMNFCPYWFLLLFNDIDP